MCVALAALDASVQIEGPNGRRTLKFVDFHRLPADRPDIETDLARDELITAIVVPWLAFGTASTYRKVRDRASYAFALVSVAAALDIASGRVRDVRLALGGALPALGPLGIGVTTLGELLLQIGQHLLNLGFSISSRSNWEFADNVAVLIRNHGYERKIVIGTLNYLAKVFGHESLLAYR